MKKGLSLLLSLLIMISAVSCLGVVASAAEYTIYANTWYTVNSDDVCYFTAPVNGYYTFFSDGFGDPQITIYDEDGDQIAESDDRDYEADDLDFETTIMLLAGETVKCELYNHRSTDDDVKYQCRFGITYEEVKYESLALDVWYTADVNDVLYFTAPTDGTYNFKSKGNGDPKIRIYDLYGYLIAEFDDNNGLDFYGDITLSAGETVELGFYNYNDNERKCNFIITKTKKIVSIYPVVSQPVYVFENDGGYWETDEYNNKYYYYDDFNLKDAVKHIIVSYDTGDADSYIYDYGIGTYCNIQGRTLRLDVVTNQYKNHWYKGTNNALTLSYEGQEFSVPVTVVENNKGISSISYWYGPSPLQLIYNVDGYLDWDYDDNDNRIEYFRYTGIDLFKAGSTLTVNYVDGSKTVYTYSYEKGFTAPDGSRLPGYVEAYSEQGYDKQWQLGTNYATIYYKGSKCYVPVNVIENPYSWAEFVLSDNQLYENIDGYQTSSSSNPYFRYDISNVMNRTGNAIKFYYRNGGEVLYYYNSTSGEWIDAYGNEMSHDFTFTDTQNTNHWYVNSTYPVTVDIAGYESNTYVNVVPNPVTWISFTPAVHPVLYEGINGGIEINDETGQQYFRYYISSDDYIYTPGSKLTVNYNDGSAVTYTYHEDKGFLDPYGNRVNYSFDHTVDQEKHPWYVGPNNFVQIEYMDRTCNVAIEIKPANQAPARTLIYNAEYDEYECRLGNMSDHSYTGLVYYNNDYYYVSNGWYSWEYSGLAEYNGGYYYVTDGKINWWYTGITKYENNWYYVSNGCLDWGYTGLVFAYDQWYYVENGFISPEKDTLVFNNGEWFGVQDGRVNWAENTLIYYNGDYYFVTNGRVAFGYTGLALVGDDWYYIYNGLFAWWFTDLVPYNNEWFYVQNGVINWNAKTLTYYNDKWYYIEDGKINWNSDTLVNYDGIWYCAKYGEVAWWYTGLMNYNNTWYYVENGVVNWNSDTLVNYNGNWYCAKYGEVAWWYTGLMNYNNTWYYVENGAVNWYSDTLVFYNNEWFYAYCGEVAWWYTGLVNYNGTWYYVENGAVNWYSDTLVFYNNEWFYAYGGELAWWYTGLVYYGNEFFYVEDGKVNWESDTLVEYNGEWYYTRYGRVAWDYTGYVTYEGRDYYITNGYLDWANN